MLENNEQNASPDNFTKLPLNSKNPALTQHSVPVSPKTKKHIYNRENSSTPCKRVRKNDYITTQFPSITNTSFKRKSSLTSRNSPSKFYPQEEK